MTFVVGLTAADATGKSAVSDRFADLGIKIVDADVASRVVVEPGQPALEKIAEHFGAEMITAEGALDRAALRHKVFADDVERDWLQKLLHPLINAWISDQLNSADSAYAMLAHPILIETGQTAICDRVLVACGVSRETNKLCKHVRKSVA